MVEKNGSEFVWLLPNELVLLVVFKLKINYILDFIIFLNLCACGLFLGNMIASYLIQLSENISEYERVIEFAYVNM